MSGFADPWAVGGQMTCCSYYLSPERAKDLAHNHADPKGFGDGNRSVPVLRCPNPYCHTTYAERMAERK